MKPKDLVGGAALGLLILIWALLLLGGCSSPTGPTCTVPTCTPSTSTPSTPGTDQQAIADFSLLGGSRWTGSASLTDPAGQPVGQLSAALYAIVAAPGGLQAEGQTGDRTTIFWPDHTVTLEGGCEGHWTLAGSLQAITITAGDLVCFGARGIRWDLHRK